MTPTLSVVIASVNGIQALAECLGALERQRGAHRVQIVVVASRDDDTGERVRLRFPVVELVLVPPRAGIPRYWCEGIRHARGDIVAVTEDHCIPRDDWFERIVEAQALGCDVVSGAVENGAVERVTDWAVFLCDYSHVMPPIPSGSDGPTAGNNIAYRREALERAGDELERAHWEYFLHAEMRARGARFCTVPSMVVLHKKTFRIGYALSQRFHYSRSFAAMRSERAPGWKRPLFAFACALLPVQLVARIVRNVVVRRAGVGELVLAFPLLCALGLSHAAGELAGYVAGPGDSLSRVE
jgi:GT2 family glycosyltransferase